MKTICASAVVLCKQQWYHPFLMIIEAKISNNLTQRKGKYVNSFVHNAPFLYTLKASENRKIFPILSNQIKFMVSVSNPSSLNFLWGIPDQNICYAMVCQKNHNVGWRNNVALLWWTDIFRRIPLFKIASCFFTSDNFPCWNQRYS